MLSPRVVVLPRLRLFFRLPYLRLIHQQVLILHPSELPRHMLPLPCNSATSTLIFRLTLPNYSLRVIRLLERAKIFFLFGPRHFLRFIPQQFLQRQASVSLPGLPWWFTPRFHTRVPLLPCPFAPGDFQDDIVGYFKFPVEVVGQGLPDGGGGGVEEDELEFEAGVGGEEERGGGGEEGGGGREQGQRQGGVPGTQGGQVAADGERGGEAARRAGDAEGEAV